MPHRGYGQIELLPCAMTGPARVEMALMEMALVVSVGVRDGKVAYEHIYWDQAGLLAQLGMLDPSGLPVDPSGLPVDPTAAAKLLAFTGKLPARP